MKVRYTKLHPDAQIPHRASDGAAAYDLYSTETGLGMEIPEGWKGEIYSRSGMSYAGVVVANSPGKIDSDYRGEIKVLLHNNDNTDIACIEKGDRIAQFEINPVYDIEFYNVEELIKSERGEGGFGSTGN